ncbi:hypothetical protein [Aerococcus sp. 1KP-2016]|uniref:hypothetical protein n=1 Tax=Aerococcus sp. 1KP-2016 TaxID=1981982 RepID=UPI00131458F1|nr:hypothetical protein [Aerococcus sp. 1KP-2016]
MAQGTSTKEIITHTEDDVRPFSMRDKIGYMFGDLGNDMSFMLQSMFLMVFYTEV